MHIQPVFSHPDWCDPRTCITDSQVIDHRSTPIEWKSSVDDYRLSVGLARFDGDPLLPHLGDVTVQLRLRDLASDNLDGSERAIESDLTAADARLLAAALVCVAEQLEALQQGKGGAR